MPVHRSTELWKSSNTPYTVDRQQRIYHANIYTLAPLWQWVNVGAVHVLWRLDFLLPSTLGVVGWCDGAG